MPAPGAWSEGGFTLSVDAKEGDFSVWMLSAPGSQLRLVGVFSAVASGTLAKFQWCWSPRLEAPGASSCLKTSRSLGLELLALKIERSGVVTA
jgi:hypothetical protein